MQITALTKKCYSAWTPL